MDAEHRHELKSNELANTISNLPQYIKDHPNQVIGVVLILVGLISWPLFNKMKNQSEIRKQSELISMIDLADQARGSYLSKEQDKAPESLTAAAQSLQEEADKTSNPNLAAIALIKKGNALRADIHLAAEANDELISARVSEARTAYEKALNKADMPAVKGLAQMGLGLCAEETKEYGKAREIYNAILKEAAYTGTVVPMQAQRRLDAMDDNSVEVTFAPAPVEPETPAAGADLSTVPPLMGSTEGGSPAQPAAAPEVPAAAPEAATEAPAAPAPAEQPSKP